MIIRYERPVSHAAQLSRRIAQIGLMLCLAALVAHRFGFMLTPSFVVFILLSALLSAVAMFLALVGLVRLWQVGAEGGMASLKALLASILPLALFGMGFYAFQVLPPVADVTSDHEERPEWLKPPDANQIWMPLRDKSPEGVLAETAAYPELTGRRYEGAMDRVYRAVTKVAKAERIQVIAESGIENAIVDIEDSSEPAKAAAQPEAPSDRPADTPEIGPLPTERPQVVPDGLEPRGDVVIQGETRTFILGLPFDVVVRLREDAETTYVDIRVAARYGPRDLGIGADIAEDFLKALDGELLGIAGG